MCFIDVRTNTNVKKLMDLTIRPVKTSKDQIKQPKLSEMGIIMRLGSSSLLCGRSGSGKTTLLHNLICDSRFLDAKLTFKNIFLFSPSGSTDDIQISLGIRPEFICTDLEKGPDMLKTIYEHQTTLIEELGSSKAPQVCIIFDDVISHTRFMGSRDFIRSFVASRHFNCTVLLCSQHFNKVPKEAGFLFFWPMSRSALDILCDEFCPSAMNRKQFCTMVEDVLDEPYCFLTINMKSEERQRFRRNLDQVINIDAYRK